MKRKIGTTIVGLSIFSFGLFGVNIGDGGVVKAEHGHTGAPAYNIGDTGGAPAYDHGRPPISSYNKGDTWAPSFTNTHGEGWAPKKETHADLIAPTLESHGNTGGAPAYNIGDTPAPKIENHGDYGGAPANTEPGGGI
ncbi:hypothetical protein [Bacillus paramycoides]|uniref:hypothetical protein n=1 Tax=Bacillus paramycoides TaxID=2026194 RepID=UPI002E1DA4BA|nr:hypothetical protein [Bacillus paramycoides]